MTEPVVLTEEELQAVRDLNSVAQGYTMSAGRSLPTPFALSIALQRVIDIAEERRHSSP